MSFKRSFYEFARCTKHNLLHLKRFKMGFRDPNWIIHHDRGTLLTCNYPYHACEDGEGYLKNGEWFIQPGEVVIDAGGCFGEFAIYASQCVGSAGRVLLLEPDQDNLAIAKKNAKLNGNPSNLTMIAAGLWHKRGKVRFSSGQEQTSSIVSEHDTSAQSIEVPTLTLADVVRDYKLDRLDFVKMDIEGAELEALSVAGDLPANMKPRYAIASYHLRDGQPTAARCEAMLQSLGYQTSTGNVRHPTTWAIQ